MQITIPISYDLVSQIYPIILFLNINNGYDSPAVKLLKSVIKQNKLQALDEYLSKNSTHLDVFQLSEILNTQESQIRNALGLKTTEELELEKLLNLSTKEFGLSLRTQKALAQVNIQTVRQLVNKTAKEIKTLDHVGPLTFREILQTLRSHDLSLLDSDFSPEDEEDFFPNK